MSKSSTLPLLPEPMWYACDYPERPADDNVVYRPGCLACFIAFDCERHRISESRFCGYDNDDFTRKLSNPRGHVDSLTLEVWMKKEGHG
jgi:hypothetical protein